MQAKGAPDQWSRYIQRWQGEDALLWALPVLHWMRQSMVLRSLQFGLGSLCLQRGRHQFQAWKRCPFSSMVRMIEIQMERRSVAALRLGGWRQGECLAGGWNNGGWVGTCRIGGILMEPLHMCLVCPIWTLSCAPYLDHMPDHDREFPHRNPYIHSQHMQPYYHISSPTHARNQPNVDHQSGSLMMTMVAHC